MIAVTDSRIPLSARAKLKSICEVVELPPFSALDVRVASHPDMLMFGLSGKLFVSGNYYKEAKIEIDQIIALTELELILTSDSFGARYPNDIKFNCFYLGNSLVGSIKNISPEVKSQGDSLGLMLTNVKQGYAKCSAVVLDGAVISADSGICAAARGLGADALLISPEGVRLDGYDCGFIGGASGVWKNQVFFCGNITAHKDYDSILKFCAAREYDVISLSDEPLYDVGTILFFD